MTQETGETRNAILEEDEKRIQAILDANSNRRDPYWIVLFAKPSKTSVEGMPTLVKHIKAYATKPQSQVGMCVAEVDPVKGSIEWEVNMPQRPFDFDALHKYGAEEKHAVIKETASIPHAYLTR